MEQLAHPGCLLQEEELALAASNVELPPLQSILELTTAYRRASRALMITAAGPLS